MASTYILEEALRQMAAGVADVHLGDSRIGDGGAERVSEGLKQNVTLKTLDLSYNSIGDWGARAVAEALKQNGMLHTLVLDGNDIGIEGARALAEALKQNSTLQTLSLEGNDISGEGARAMAEALQQNRSLQELDLRFNGCDEDEVCEILELVKRNKETCIILQVTTMPSTGEIEDNGSDVVVTKMNGEQVCKQPLQPETTLRHVAVEVGKLCQAPLANLRWVLPGAKTVGAESLDDPLQQLLQGGPG